MTPQTQAPTRFPGSMARSAPARGVGGAAVPAGSRPGWRHLARRLDPRLYQIVALAGLLGYGSWKLGFDTSLPIMLLILAAALATQHACTHLWKLPAFEPRSALISALSLCLLLRTNDPRWAVVAAIVAVASKFVLRVDGKHVFNPTNFGLVVLMLLTDAVWVSPGQWGNAAFFGFLLACLGGMVVHRSSRSDVTWSFLLFYGAVLLGRSLWLGEPWAIPLHCLQNGALLLFAFFMISDPRTTPDSRLGRIVYALVVALGAGFVHFVLFENNGLLWSLVACAPLVPLINRVLPGTQYQWSAARAACPRVRSARRSWSAKLGTWMAGLRKAALEQGVLR